MYIVNQKYTDWNGVEKEEELCFNITKAELLTMEKMTEGGYHKLLEKLMKEKDVLGLLDEVNKILILAYGIKSEDGKKFVKNDDIREEFVSTAAYDAIWTRIMTDENFAQEFVAKVLPSADELQKMLGSQQAATSVIPMNR